MKFKLWLNEVGEISEASIPDILMRKSEIEAAVSNLSRGMPSMTPGPVLVAYHESLNKYELVNGYHRVIEALLNGKTTIQIQNKELAQWSPPSSSDIFVPDFDREYFGMEDFIELYELKRL